MNGLTASNIGMSLILPSVLGVVTRPYQVELTLIDAVDAMDDW